jgi:hypothetical protein
MVGWFVTILLHFGQTSPGHLGMCWFPFKSEKNSKKKVF